MSRITLPNGLNNFIDRPEQLERLSQSFLKDKCLAIYGEKGCGKSTLASQIYQENLQFSQKFWWEFDEKCHCPFTNPAREILQDLGYTSMPIDLKELAHLTAQALAEKNCLVVLDGLETSITRGDFSSSTIYRLFIDYCLDLKVHFVVTSNFLPKEGFLGIDWHRLENLNKTQAKKLVKKLGLLGDEKNIEELIDKTQSNPGKLKQIINYLRGELGVEVLEEAITLFDDSLKKLIENSLEELIERASTEKKEKVYVDKISAHRPEDLLSVWLLDFTTSNFQHHLFFYRGYPGEKKREILKTVFSPLHLVQYSEIPEVLIRQLKVHQIEKTFSILVTNIKDLRSGHSDLVKVLSRKSAEIAVEDALSCLKFASSDLELDKANCLTADITASLRNLSLEREP